MYKSKGIVRLIEPEQQRTEKFKTRNIVIVTGDTYPQTLSFQAMNQNCDMFDDLRVGDEIEIGFKINGKLWKDDRYFNTLVVNMVKWLAHHEQIKTKSQPIEQQESGIIIDNSPRMDAPDDLPF